MNMGQITQIAFELKNLQQQALDAESSDGEADEDEMTEEQLAKHQEKAEWLQFCRNKISKIEKIWNRKLEESSTGDDDSDDNSDKRGERPEDEEDDDNLSHEELINKMLNNVGGRNPREKLGKSAIGSQKRDPIKDDLSAVKESLAALSKDSNDLVQSNKADVGDLGSTPEFAGNNYWRPPVSEDDLDEMLRAEGMLE